MLIPSVINEMTQQTTSLSRRVNANSQLHLRVDSRDSQAYQEG